MVVPNNTFESLENSEAFLWRLWSWVRLWKGSLKLDNKTQLGLRMETFQLVVICNKVIKCVPDYSKYCVESC